MKIYCNIAGLTVEINSFGRVIDQAQPYMIEQPSKVDFAVETDWTRIKALCPHLSDEDCEYVGTGASFYRQLLNFEGLMLHSSAVVADGKAYLFSANSGTGKSTHTGLWLELFGERAFILNDDKPALRKVDGVWYAYGTPWSGKNNVNANACAPLAGIACLERGERNRIHPFVGQETVLSILRQCNRPKAIEYRSKLLSLVDQLITEVPIWKLSCNMDPEAAIVSYEAMSGQKWRSYL